jgi:hypothetical protein
MVVGSFGKTRRRDRMRTLAFLLLVSVSALTLTPVCGSALDVDAGECCQQRGCHETSAACDRVTKSKEPANSQGDCCSPTAKSSPAPSGPDRCCERGQLTYPTIKAQSSVSATVVLPLTLVIALPPSTMSTPFTERVVWEAAPKISIRPLYTLTATYRI